MPCRSCVSQVSSPSQKLLGTPSNVGQIVADMCCGSQGASLAGPDGSAGAYVCCRTAHTILNPLSNSAKLVCGLPSRVLLHRKGVATVYESWEALHD